MKKIMPDTYFCFVLALMFPAHYLLPVYEFLMFPYNLTGIPLVIFGFVWIMWSHQLVQNEKTTIKPNEKPSTLILRGPFCISRHPMYLGAIILLIGVALLLGSVSTFIPILFLYMILRIYFIPMEECNCAEIFGDAYAQYKSRTPAFF